MGGKKLGKNDEKNAKLRDKKGRSWDVKLVTSSGDIRPHFKDGWEKFCKECDLQVGDFLVFRHQGKFIFDVYIFDPTTCERELPILLESRSKIEASNNPNKIKSPRIAKKMLKVEDKEEIKMREEEENSTFKPSSYPYCRTVVTHGPGSHEMPLPREFAEKNGLSKRWCEMELIDEKGHPWKMLLRHYRKGNGSPYIGSWKAFRKANGLNTGDAVIFQLIHSGERGEMIHFKFC